MLTYAEVGATRPDSFSWDPPRGFRSHEESLRLGLGADTWSRAVRAVMAWEVKTRSGFSVLPAHAVLGAEPSLQAHLGPLALREPVRVVAVVEHEDRVGFAYGTLTGHPVCGEEAFVVHRESDGSVWLTLRSFTRPGRGAWRLAYPAVLLAQRVYRRRYRRAL